MVIPIIFGPYTAVFALGGYLSREGSYRRSAISLLRSSPPCAAQQTPLPHQKLSTSCHLLYTPLPESQHQLPLSPGGVQPHAAASPASHLQAPWCMYDRRTQRSPGKNFRLRLQLRVSFYLKFRVPISRPSPIVISPRLGYAAAAAASTARTRSWFSSSPPKLNLLGPSQPCPALSHYPPAWH